jgi:hypothetical protein
MSRLAAWRRLVIPGLAVLLLAACGETGPGPGVATNPPGGGTAGGGGPSGSPSAGQVGVRTVLSTLGLNIRSGPGVSNSKVGTAAQGVVLTVLDHSDQNGGWYKVQGQTVTGWITADASLSAPGEFTAYRSSQRGFNALYPQNWTFAEEPADVFFHPVDGVDTIVVRSGASTADFGAAGDAGFTGSGSESVVVCGVTGDLLQFTRGGGATATPKPGTVGRLAHLAQVRLHLDATHALALDFNYAAASDLDVFRNFYNAMTFPFPQCQQAPAAPAPT